MTTFGGKRKKKDANNFMLPYNSSSGSCSVIHIMGDIYNTADYRKTRWIRDSKFHAEALSKQNCH